MLPDDVIKNMLRFKTEQNGLFLKIHHTKPLKSTSMMSDEGSNHETEKQKRLKFILADVMSCNEAFAAFDDEDNVFIFHLTDKCFWQLPIDAKVQKCSAIKFVPRHKNNLLIGNKFGFIYEIEINSGRVQRCIKAFFDVINQLLFSTSDPRMLVATSNNQIKIYDYENFRKKFEYAREHQKNNDVKISLVKIIPNDETCRIVVVLRNNIICILSNSLKLIRHYEPLKARQRYLQRFSHKIEKLNYTDIVPDEIGEGGSDDDGGGVENSGMRRDADKLIKSLTRDYSHGVVTDVSFSCDGNHLIVSFLDNFIMLCSTIMWDVRRVIKYPDGLFIKQCDFIPFTTEHSNKMLLTLTSNDDLMLMSLKDFNAKTLINMNNSCNFVLSTNGKILLNIQHSGEILVYNMEKCLSESMTIGHYCGSRRGDATTQLNGRNIAKPENNCQWNVELGKIQCKINSTIPKGRLLPILKEFNEYPDKHRAMIWKTIFQLPLNYAAFARLVRSGLHSCVDNFREKFSLVDHKTRNSLIKIVSCLSHWTSIFGYVSYIPKFVLPFLKVSRGDLLICFEIVATLILNHCQLWFEFAPMQMPYNYFSLIENVLMESDGKLYEFYKSKNVTPKIYAWPLMETAFAEVFDERQWYQLWDHIISNEPFFIVFIIVAYSIESRLIIMKTDDVNEIEIFFREQTFVNIKKVIKQAYHLMSKCPTKIHPSRYMKPFIPLVKGEYQKFQNYPKNVASVKVNEIDMIRAEQKALDEKLEEMSNVEKVINARLQNHLIDEEHSRRMREVEKSYERALEEEEERISCQRKMLLLSMKKIRQRENEMKTQGHQSVLRKQLEMRENELEVMLRKLDKQRNREEIELKMAEENLKLKELSLGMKDSTGNQKVDDTSLGDLFEKSIQQLEHQKQKFMKELEAISYYEMKEMSSETRKEKSRKTKTAEKEEQNNLEKNSTKTTSRYLRRATDENDDENDVVNISSNHSEVDELESCFQRIQNGYLEAIKNDGDKADYVERMKDLDILEKEIYELLKNSM